MSILSLAASVSFAAPQGRGSRTQANASGLDMTNVQTVQGAVTAVNVAYGAQYPSIEIAGRSVKVAPAWYFLENDFELRTGDTLLVDAAPSTNPADLYLYALRITNTATNAHIELRDAAGLPLWAGHGRQGRSSAGIRRQLDTKTVITVTGQIDSVVYGVGIQMPSITIRTSDGGLIIAALGPERVLLAADVELKPGDSITATLAKCTYRDQYVVLSLTLADGRTVVLRDADGTPVWP